MKTSKITSYLFYCLIFVMLSACIVLFAWVGKASAELTPPGQNPYSFGPEGRSIESLDQAFGKPSEMTSIVPNRPIAAREKDGSRVFFSPDGNLTLRISKDGSQEFSLGWKSKDVDAEGALQKKSELVKGTNQVITKNEKGEVLSYKEMGFGGKAVKEFDAEKNLTKTYAYDKYAKNVEYVLDELSQSKTVFAKNAQPQYDLDFEGNVVARYTSDAEGRVATKVDAVGNTTYFDKSGNMTYTANIQGTTILQYYYEKDDAGRYVLVKAENGGDITYFKDGKQQYTVNSNGIKTTEYFWQGSKLVYSFKAGFKETTYYDVNGKEQYTASNGVLVKQWLYMKGRLVGSYDGNTNITTLYQYQRQDITMNLPNEPTAEQIQKWYDDGLIEEIKAGSPN